VCRCSGYGVSLFILSMTRLVVIGLLVVVPSMSGTVESMAGWCQVVRGCVQLYGLAVDRAALGSGVTFGCSMDHVHTR
jgi:hypothetical protein